ncbi:MAG: PKD domain-containing protein [Cytophagaceae bacterium]
MLRRFAFVLLISLLFLEAYSQGNQTSSLRFTENKNQWPSNVQYRADLPGGKLFLEKSSFTYVFYDTEKLARMHQHEHKEAGKETGGNHSEDNHLINMHALRVSLLGANTLPVIGHKDPAGELRNYFIGKDPSHWASNVSSFTKVSYQGIYPYTTLELFEDRNHLKYQYIIAKGGNPSSIRMKYEGADSIYIQNGQLFVQTSLNTITEEAPYSYQLIDGKKVFVPSAFTLKDHILSFSFPQGYDRNYELIIDPKLIFSTYSGSSADNWGNTATFDKAGNLYSGGSVFGVGFPSTTGAFQVNYGGVNTYGVGIDVGILKYNAAGNNLLYATYLGGTNSEVPHSLIVNENNELLIFGSTSSSETDPLGFPTTLNAYDRTFNGGVYTYPFGSNDAILYQHGCDIFISKLDSTGSSLLASTYLGGSANDGILYQYDFLTKNYGDQFRGEIVTDKNSNVYIASSTQSADFPIINGFQSAHANPGGHDAVVVKLNQDLSSIVWSTYLGGSGQDVAFCLALDSVNNVFVGGGTRSADFPATDSSLFPNSISTHDGFVAAIDKNCDSLLASTYLGTSAYDQVYFVQLDAEENVYALGQSSGSYPVSPGVYSDPNSGQFIHKMSKMLDSSMFSTVIGNRSGAPNLSPTAFLVNDCGNIFLAGWGGDVNDPSDGYIGGNTNGMTLTSDAFQSSTDGSDFYIMAIEKGAKSLLYATYIGGNSNVGDHVDGGTSRFDKKGIIYHSVCAGCGGNSSFPTTPGAWSTTNKSYFEYNNTGFFFSNCNNAAFKFDLASLKADFIADTTMGCWPLPVNFINKSVGGKSFTWIFGDGSTQSTPTATPVNHTYANPGTYPVLLIATDLTTCTGRDTASGTISVFTLSPAAVPSSYVICRGDSVQLDAGANASYTYAWSPTDSLSNPSIYNPYANPSQKTIYHVTITDNHRCSIILADTVDVANISKGGSSAKNITDCSGPARMAFQNSSIGPLNYHWDFGDGQTSTDQNPQHEYPDFGTYTVVVNIFNNFCSGTDTLHLNIKPIKLPNLITPNGDSLNEAYVIEGNPGEWHFDVYNIWGEPVFKSDDYKNNWNAEGLANGIYYYLITTPAHVQCKGWVHVIK